jgi:hypothetical protein
MVKAMKKEKTENANDELSTENRERTIERRKMKKYL